MSRRYWYVILTYIIMQLSGALFAPILAVVLDLSLMDATIYWSIFSFGLAVLITLYLLKPDMQMRNDNAAGIESIILWSIAGFFMALFAQGIAAQIEIALGIDPGSENTQQIMDITRAAPIFMIVPAILAPILEEIIFRKIIFGELYKRMNFFFAGLLSAVIFGFIHLDPTHILIYASMGFVFAFLYVKTKRIIVPIIVHAAMNSFVVLMQYNIDPEELQRMLDEMQMIFFGG
ncbi:MULTISPECIES: type II CAAX endopeptidase family protein [Oceanobacillus]|uniref:Membrane peptidase YdiL n=1 Tax=Oceanobacillus kimchii TaxID=746691 RepID=A0ABQ5TDZ0_9BACI|nr:MULTISPECIES: type II CAAX endopeptidase family protein [Oceanobacillus]MBT2600681.1 CPBP family intramembrane metalloprotease [Oceanobacillus sp. ISL-74]MBT2650922.1 CPBP family intramembrane metalloprotease [Oceanobacillus sp. ISL-73]OEH53478.1 peptidase [Oceanobacillus sp. E9]GLO65001.1 putative membrane peptidase YdiL [Oceanobacillus kimchii]